MQKGDHMPADGLFTPEMTAEWKHGSSALKVFETLKANLKLISRAVVNRESRLSFGRVLRTTASVRSQVTAQQLQKFFSEALSPSAARSVLMENTSATEVAVESEKISTSSYARSADVDVKHAAWPEEELYCYFLLCQFLCDKKQFSKLHTVADKAVEHAHAHNRRTLDVLAARCTFYLSLAAEATGDLAVLRPRLLSLHATAVLNHDDLGQETLLSLLLRNYLHYSLYDQAEKFRAQAQRPEAPRSNQQYCRYLFYLGRIRAVQLEYSEAKECLQQAARKAPMVAQGFSIHVHKWLTVIRLLLGELPSQSELDAPSMHGVLRPYLALTTAVRSGDVTAFNSVALTNADVFLADHTHNLINRLRYNVLRAGLRRISVAYSRISLQDVANKLGLPNITDTEAVVAKTIRDGSISARLDHEKHCLASCEVGEAYATKEPASAFHARTAFCMDIHNDAVRAMRYDTIAVNECDDGATHEQQVDIETIAAAMADEGDF